MTIQGAPTVPAVEQEGRGGQSAIRFVSCVIRPEKLDAVKDALNELNLVGGMTVMDVRGFGRQKGQMEYYRGGAYTIRFIDKVRLDLAIPREDVEKVMLTICRYARTGHVGDGKIFVTRVVGVLRVRTGEMGTSAL